MEPSRRAFEIRGPLSKADLPGLYARACARLTRDAGRSLVIELMAVEPDAVAVDALARLALAARRRGCGVTLQGAADELRQLIELAGLGSVFAVQSSREGNPNSGNTRSVSRKNVSSPIEAPDSSMT